MNSPGSADSARVGLRVMVTGSRGWSDKATLRARLDELPHDDLTILEGGARGADEQAFKWSIDNRVPSLTFLPARSFPSPQRYHLRNDQMLAEANLVLAFWDGKSRGTKSVIDKARSRGIECEVVYARPQGADKASRS